MLLNKSQRLPLLCSVYILPDILGELTEDTQIADLFPLVIFWAQRYDKSADSAKPLPMAAARAQAVLLATL